MNTEAAITMDVDATGGKAAPGIDWEQTDLYRFFAFTLASPSAERFQFLSQAALPAALQNLWRRLECAGDYPGFEWFSRYQDYEAAYIAVFDVGMPEPPVPLFESAHDKTYPAQEIALENTFFYQVLGLSSNPNRAVPDYLITQLEFLSALRYTAENAVDEDTVTSLRRAEVEFLERHLLNWVPKATEKLQKSEAPGFALLMTLLTQFLLQKHAGSL